VHLGGIVAVETGTSVSGSAVHISHPEQTDAKGGAVASKGSCACWQGRRSLAKDACLEHAEIKVSVTTRGWSDSRASQHVIKAWHSLLRGSRPLTRAFAHKCSIVCAAERSKLACVSGSRVLIRSLQPLQLVCRPPRACHFHIIVIVGEYSSWMRDWG
jgi:hypothetical protein